MERGNYPVKFDFAKGIGPDTRDRLIRTAAVIKGYGKEGTKRRLLVVELSREGFTDTQVDAALSFLARSGIITRTSRGCYWSDRRLLPVPIRIEYGPNESCARPASERVYVAKDRKCLKCGIKFESEWPGNRVCVQCKSHADWKSGSADMSVRYR